MHLVLLGGWNEGWIECYHDGEWPGGAIVIYDTAAKGRAMGQAANLPFRKQKKKKKKYSCTVQDLLFTLVRVGVAGGSLSLFLSHTHTIYITYIYMYSEIVHQDEKSRDEAAW